MIVEQLVLEVTGRPDVVLDVRSLLPRFLMLD